MKCMSRQLSLALTFASLMVVLSPLEGSSLRALPSDAEIETWYSATNASDVLYGRLKDLLCEMREHGKEYPTNELFHVQNLLLTNMVMCPIKSRDLWLFVSEKNELLNKVCSFDLLKENKLALMYVVDYCGTLQCVPTNDLPAECISAWNADASYREQLGTNYWRIMRTAKRVNWYRYPHPTPNMNGFLEKWVPKVSFNGLVPGLRRELTYCLNPAVNRHMMDMNEAEKLQFRSNIIERAKLDEREARLLFR